MDKTITIKIRGNKVEILQAEILIRMIQDFNKLGIPFETAMRQVTTLVDSCKKDK